MSLTGLIRHDPNIKSLFKEYFDKPRLPPGPDMKAPPLTEDYQLVGTAFDYLLRFKVARLNSDKTSPERKHGWVAEAALDRIEDDELKEKAEFDIKEARERRDKFIEKEDVTEELLKSAIRLARLDPIFRAGRGKEYIGDEIKTENVEDLKNLIACVPEQEFTAENHCLLNPTFGRGSLLVGGADADLIVDNSIIDFKTTKRWRSRRRSFNQLAGYYALFKIDDLEHVDSGIEISILSIYFSRHGVLHNYHVEDLISENELEEFIGKLQGVVEKRWEMRRAAIEERASDEK